MFKVLPIIGYQAAFEHVLYALNNSKHKNECFIFKPIVRLKSITQTLLYRNVCNTWSHGHATVCKYL